MYRRVEKKYILEPSQRAWFLKWLSSNSATTLFPQRYISSLYFDSSDLLLYRKTKEGITPREKVRIRCYGGHGEKCSSSHSLEIKRTTFSGREKESTSDVNFHELASKGITLPGVGTIHPVLRVSYFRSYYMVKGFRVTLDEEIQYLSEGDGHSLMDTSRERSIGLELKADSSVSLDRIENLFPFPTRQFSKYERGIDATVANAFSKVFEIPREPYTNNKNSELS